MGVKKKGNSTKAKIDEQTNAPFEENASPEDFPNELRLPVWSVVSFDKCEAGGLTYAQAEQKLRELDARKVSGLCIVTDEVAARIAVKN